MPVRKKLQEPFFSELRKVEEGWKSLPLKLKARRHHWQAWWQVEPHRWAGTKHQSLVHLQIWEDTEAAQDAKIIRAFRFASVKWWQNNLSPEVVRADAEGMALSIVEDDRLVKGLQDLAAKSCSEGGLQRLFGSRPQMRNRQVGGACHLAWAKGSGVFLAPYSRTTALLAPRDLRQLTKQGRNCYWHCRGRKSCGPGVGQDACFPSSPFAFIEEVGHHEGHASQIEMQRCATCEQGRHDGKLSSQLDPVAKQGGNGPNWLSIRSFHLMSSRQPFECRCSSKSKPGGHDVAYPERYRCRDFEAYDSTYVGLSGWQDGSGQMFF